MYDVHPVLITARCCVCVGGGGGGKGGWGDSGGDSKEFLLGLCGLNPDPISDQKI